MTSLWRTDFNDLLVESVNEVISDVLGFRVKEALWYHCQAYLGITEDEMPYRLDVLFKALKDSFGIGGETIGRTIVKKLYAKAGVPLSLTLGRPLVDYVEELKETLAKNLMQQEIGPRTSD